ncbi:YybH family protein [Geotalea toluenoxydans]
MRPLFIFGVVLLFSGCTGGDDDRQAIQTVMSQRQQAFRNKDINVYLSLISPHYQDQGQDLAAKKRELALNFASFEQVDYRSDGYKIEVNGKFATVSGTYRLKIVRKGQVLELAGKESLHLRKEGKGWLIVGGL